ncbi:MAG: hypothetical protein JW951_00665, partial [Lentisphaerae bacterium]|nr:hypothetical protein [Lentisphaerota bacterium]
MIRARIRERLVLWLALAACGAGAGPAFEPPSVFESASGRFVVVGAEPARNMAVLREAETLARKVERITDVPLPGGRDGAVRVVLERDPEAAPGAAAVAGTVLDRPVARLRLTNTTELAAGGVREPFCRAVL